MRRGMFQECQNQGLSLYKVHMKEWYALWAIETMYLIRLTLPFETKLMDIAYLLLLKLAKEQ